MKVVFRASFQKDLESTTNPLLKERVLGVIEAVEAARQLSEVPGVKKLSGKGGHFRIRVLGHRIGLTIDGGIVTFVRCLDRKSIYRYFP